MLNKVQFIGHLGRDPETRHLPSGEAVCNFSVASTEKWKDKQTGEQKEATEWLRCSAFGRLAEICGDWLEKGSLVYVEGELKTRKYNGSDGVERYATECRVDTMKMLGRRRSEDAAPAHQNGASRPAPGRAAPPPTGHAATRPAPATGGSGFDDMDDDIPFISSCMGHDMLTSKAKRMARYDY